MLQFENYKKNFGSATVLSIPDLYLNEGIYWLQGENGSGKTTLLKSIAGLIPFDGKIAVAGHSIRNQRMRYKRMVNYAEAEPVYPPFLTGNDLLQFYYNTKGGSKEASAKLLNAFGVNNYIHTNVRTCSSGMLKKLSLLLAFTGMPKLILLDEPLITLDTDSVSVLQNVIAHYQNKGVSFLVTSHQAFLNPPFTVLPLLLKDKTLL